MNELLNENKLQIPKLKPINNENYKHETCSNQ